MSKDVLHVVPHNAAWAVKREGNERTSSTHDTQRDAIENARNLAKEGDDIVIHRPDGTIRERSTYMMTQDKANGSKTPVTPADVMSVGSRVSWPAVLAGAVVALAAYLTLNLLAMAIGFSTLDNVPSRDKLIPAGIVMTVSLIASLFLGGYIASLTTAGENHREAVIYGVLVWGAMFGLALLFGSAASTGIGSLLGAAKPADTRAMPPVEEVKARLDLTEDQARKYAGVGRVVPPIEEMRSKLELNEDQANKYAAMVAESGSVPMSKSGLAWYSFLTVVLSLLAAMGGAYMGAGPELVLRRIFVPQSSPGGLPNPA